MIQRFNKRNFQQICDRLASVDPDLSGIIDAHRYPPMWTRPNTFETLVHIILEQQVSLASAMAALHKLRERLTTITPDRLLTLTDEDMKACYVSRQKALYTRGLATALLDRKLDLIALEAMADDEVRGQLIHLKGIGHWTIDVYLMFVLQRTDVFPTGDLAAMNAMKRVKKLPQDTAKEQLLKIAEKWQPYRTVATMLLWHLYLSSPMRPAAAKKPAADKRAAEKRAAEKPAADKR
jgi:DNA-3-methyladenine glycosylase II